MDLKMEYIDDGNSFMAIDPLFINPDYITDFFIFERYPSDDISYRFRCLLVDSGLISKEKLVNLLRSWGTVYIHKEQYSNYTKHIKENLENILKNDEINLKKKTNTITTLSTAMIKEVFQTHHGETTVNPDVMERAEVLISKVVEFISDIESLNGFADLIGHDYDTHTHSLKVGWLMAIFINTNRDLFPEYSKENFKDFLIKVTAAGFLHDIGKTKIPKSILNKRGALNNLEFITVQAHTAYSLSLLYENNLPRFSMQAVLYHHENEDGSGYPCGIKSDQIPIAAKICHIIDVFEALTSRRPYKEPKSPYDALKIMTGDNPFLETLQKFEIEARENKKVPIEAIVRNEPNVRLQNLKQREMQENEAKKRVEARLKLRDKGMSHCFDPELIKRFIVTMNKSESFDLEGLL